MSSPTKPRAKSSPWRPDHYKKALSTTATSLSTILTFSYTKSLGKQLQENFRKQIDKTRRDKSHRSLIAPVSHPSHKVQSSPDFPLLHTVMRTSIQIKEPIPTSTSYHHTGIGGAGNVRRVPPPTSLTSPLAQQPSTSTRSRAFTGRGGAGNILYPGDYRPMFSLDEEADRLDKLAPVTFHTGRGGEGNAVHLDRRGSIESAGSRSGSEKGHRSLDIAREWLKKW